jgi:hypothetical protein
LVPRSVDGYLGVEFNRNNAFTFDFTPSFAKFDQEGTDETTAYTLDQNTE